MEINGPVTTLLDIAHRHRLSTLENKLWGELVDDLVPIVNLSLQPPVAQRLVLQHTGKLSIQGALAEGLRVE